MRLYRSGEFCKRVGISKRTLFNYINKGIIKPTKVLPSGQYRFSEKDVEYLLDRGKSNSNSETQKKVGIYCRVSTREQKPHLQNQINVCKLYVYENKLGEIINIYSDIASSFNFKRKGLNKLLKDIIQGEIDILVIYDEDRLSRIAYELFENLFKMYSVEIRIVNNDSSTEDYMYLVKELISFIHYITSKIYGIRKYKKDFLKTLKKELDNEIVNENSDNEKISDK